MITIPNMIGAVASFELDVMSSSSEGYVYCSSKHAKYGEPGAGHYYEYTKSNGNTGRKYKEDVPPGPGKAGKQGADGFVLVYWDKEEAT